MSELVMKYGVVDPPHLCIGCRPTILDRERAHRCRGHGCECPKCASQTDQLRAQVARLEKAKVRWFRRWLMLVRGDAGVMREVFMDWRDIPKGKACRDCAGAGVVMYGDGSTWRGGPAGQVCTVDVCSSCWGSGRSDRAWPSHREMLQLVHKNLLQEKRIAKLEQELAAAKAPPPVSRKRRKR